MKPAARAIPVLLLVLLILLAIGLVPRLYEHSQLRAEVNVQNEPMRVEYVKPRAVVDAGLTLPSTTLAMEDAYIQGRTGGYIQKRLVDIGYKVKRGQLLAIIAAPDTDAQWQQSEAQTRQGVATVRQSQADADRLQAAVAQSVANRVAGRAALEHAQAAELQARAQVIAASRTLDAQRATAYNQRAQMVLAQREWDRYKTLGQQGFVTEEDVDTKQAAYKSAEGVYQNAVGQVQTAQANLLATQKSLVAAQSDVVAARANLKADDEAVKAAVASLRSGQETVAANQENVSALQANQAHYAAVSGFERVVAPFDGVIETRSIDTGSLVDPTSATQQQTGLFEEGRTDSLRVDVQVPQSWVPVMRAGMKADVAIQELPGKTFTGTVFRVAGGETSATRTLLVEVSVPNPRGTLLPGMYATVHFAAVDAKPILRVPSTALIIDANGTRLALVDARDKVHFATVQLGRDYGMETEIVQGLNPQDRVVNPPNDDLAEGLSVTPEAAPSPSPPGH